MIYPKEYVESVKDIKLEFLNRHNIKGIILDVDNTLIDFNKKMPEGIEQWVQNLKKEGIKFCIVSNSNKEEKIKKVANQIEVPYIFFAKKPFKGGFKKACQVLQLENKNVAAMGDQIFTDVIGANRCNIFSILVKPIEEKDYLVTRIKRPLENLVIKKYLKTKNEENTKGKKQ